MKALTLISIVASFVAGIAFIVVLQALNLIHFGNLPDSDTPKTLDHVVDKPAELVQTNSVSAEAAFASKIQVDSINKKIIDLTDDLRASTVQQDLLQAKITELENLQTRIEDLQNRFDQQQVDLGNSNNHSGTLPTASLQDQDANIDFRRRGNNRDNNEYDNLVNAGVDPTVAGGIQQRLDQWQLQRLELIDQASREGWRDSDQFGDRLQELRDVRPDIRSELGDTGYDQFRYTSGDNNRVAIASIIDGSAAQIAGMQEGDIIASYAGSRVFSSRELQRATRDGTRGELVAVDILRDGSALRFDVERGPLGVTLQGIRMDPTEP